MHGDAGWCAAAPADWAQLRLARLTALADAPYAFASTRARERAFTEELWRSRTQTSAIFAAWSDDTIVGMGTAWSADDGTWQIVGMWVSPALRGRGVADLLLRAACGHQLVRPTEPDHFEDELRLTFS